MASRDLLAPSRMHIARPISRFLAGVRQILINQCAAQSNRYGLSLELFISCNHVDVAPVANGRVSSAFGHFKCAVGDRSLRDIGQFNCFEARLNMVNRIDEILFLSHCVRKRLS